MSEFEQSTIIYLVRHGNTKNNGMLYNLDQYTEGKPVEIDEQGKEQMRVIADIITARGVKISHLFASDQLRTRQSLTALRQQLIIRGSIEEAVVENYMAELRDVDAAATMALAKSKGGMAMEDFKKATRGNIYEGEFSRFVDKEFGMIYENESLETVRQRMLSVFGKIIGARKPDDSLYAVILGHGDSLRALISGLEAPHLPLLPSHYPQLTEKGYLEKGEALEVVLNLQGKMVKNTRLPDPNSIGKREKF